MTFCGGFIWLVADRSRWERLGDAFSPENAPLGPGDWWALGGLALLGLALFVGLTVIARRQETHRSYCSPPRLYRDLCRLHRLSRRERRLLESVADEAGLDQPALLFVMPERMATAESAARDADRRRRIQALRSRLFA